ncbi:unannotated protein [freshwater metagenome]|uniref:Unannotated protein n=1 Tax=freshwater metagenome TaxID=449393 RepID=A0A6J7R8I2_9ZZZZ
MGDVGRGVVELLGAERAGQPIGEAVALGKAHPQLTVGEGGQRRRGQS